MDSEFLVSPLSVDGNGDLMGCQSDQPTDIAMVGFGNNVIIAVYRN